jgi:hypothetical protein
LSIEFADSSINARGNFQSAASKPRLGDNTVREQCCVLLLGVSYSS